MQDLTPSFLTYKNSKGKWVRYESLIRRPDLVLQGEGGLERWIEAKSVQAYASNHNDKKDNNRLAKLPEQSLKNWSQWNFNY